MPRDAKMAVGLIVALSVFGIVAAVMLPVGVDAMVDDTDVSFTGISQGSTVEVKTGTLNATLDNVGDTGTNISVTLTDVDSGNTLSLTNISQGTSQTGTLEGETLRVRADSVDGSTADFTVSHPVEYGWSSGAVSLWNIIDLILVLAVFLFAIFMAMKHAP